MKQVIIQSKCDYPGCYTVESDSSPMTEYHIWGYMAAKGRKPAPVMVDLCLDHIDLVKRLIDHFRQVGDADAAIYPEKKNGSTK